MPLLRSSIQFFACGYKNAAPMGLQTGKIISENLQKKTRTNTINVTLVDVMIPS
jgi:hypothetical protein